MSVCKSIGCTSYTISNNDFCEGCLLTHSYQKENDAANAYLAHGSLPKTTQEYTGKSVSYYSVHIEDPISKGLGYTAECGDIIEALGMDFNEGNAFKAIWRKCAARTLDLKKQGYTDGLYDSEKVSYFGERMVIVETRKKASKSGAVPALNE